MRDLSFLTIADLVDLLDRSEVSSLEITEQQLERISSLDAQLNAYITVLYDQARRDAVEADRRRREGERGGLLGVPIAVKDLFLMAGIRTTAGSRVRADWVPDYSATIIQRLQTAGAVILGKTNMMEFAYGFPHPDFGETRNPWELERTAGGSSGGSAAAVAAGMAYGALGSDTGGSIRSPAAYCGIVGLKPTYGRVSRRGAVPLSWSLDHVGPLTRTVRDAAMLFDRIEGYDPRDPGSAPGRLEPTDNALEAELAGRRIGVVDVLFERHVDPAVQTIALTAVEQLAAMGAEIVHVDLSIVPMVGPTIMPIIQAEATSYHWSTIQTRAEDYSQAILDNLRLGATVLAKDYLDAQRMRRLMAEEVTEVLAGVDALVFPTQPIVAPLLDVYQLVEAPEADVLDIEIGHTGLANLTGHPAVSVPCGLTEASLPVGLQFTGKSFDERRILQMAHAYQQATTWHEQHPQL